MKKEFAQWYQDVIFDAELVDSSPVRGCFIIRPYGYAIWQKIQKILDQEISKLGAQNAYFPLLIPQSFFKKEAEHIEGFSPELAVVTHAGGKKLEEPLIIRPTSETIIFDAFSRWIKSWRDLPYKINQWANVVRWEMRSRAFLRTTEFLWQEGHTAHKTKDEAKKMAQAAIKMYKNFLEEVAAIPTISGLKTENEKFAGAEATYTIEGYMQDGKALQLCTSHVLSKGFVSSFDIKFQDENGEMVTPTCTSWGITTRVIGALIMVHGDEKGLILPPKLAPIQLVIVPIFKKGNKDKILSAAETLKNKFEKLGYSVVVDKDEQKTPGTKFYHWEVRGVPLRVELGERDIEKGGFVVVSRLEKEKRFLEIGMEEEVVKILSDIQAKLFKQAYNRLASDWHSSDFIERFGPLIVKNNGFYEVGWCGNEKCELELKKYHATIRCILDNKDGANNKLCMTCKKQAKYVVLVAKAY